MHAISRRVPTARPLARLAHSASSSRWLARQKSDPFVRQRTDPSLHQRPDDGGTAYRSRAAFKLLEIQERFRIIREGNTVLDLGCAPGAWLQVASDCLDNGRIVGVDLLRTDAIEDVAVRIIQGDFLKRETQLELSRALLNIPAGEEQGANPAARFVDVILSDMAPNITGNRTTDIANMLQLVQAVTIFAMMHLEVPRPKTPGGSLVMKYFAHPDLTEFKNQYLVPYFRTVVDFKPKSSRKDSSETYWVCLDLQPPKQPG
ncbi:23S ribosomal RNA methyltransferase [Calocera viscosa TUFC12733]|uniref:rRNA methyltransferase 2, mitochondrial n=1 Tax=Calocera viscosa (strain TUFC12733) TaxID=1330018 RepID=A0A167PJA9_CALVF|nr:23S ribosomal RNA methyltransferase [Calocera viscosa TUFC12733]